jgi:hypothetical protein
MIPVGPWAPDMPDFQNQGSTEALNVIPKAASYGPFPSFASISTALNSRCQGAIFARKSDGSGVIIAGDVTKLYRLSGVSFSNVSRLSGGAYAAAADGVWNFVQFGPFIYAFNGIDAPQQFNIDSDSNFSAMSGSPPMAVYGAVVGDFVMTGQQASARNRVQWGPINQSGSWTPSQVTQADSQDLPDGGWVQGLVGLEQAGIIFQEFCIRRCAYVGPPLIFQFGKVADNIGATIPGSIANYKDFIFFADRSGFYMIAGGYQLAPIGEQRVNRYFWNDVDQNYLHRVSAAVDPVNALYVISYPGAGNSGGNPNKMLVYAYNLDRWARGAPGDLDMVFSGATQSGFTLEQLDSVSASLDALPFSLDSVVWTGIARRLVGGFDTGHKLGFFNGPALAATVDSTEANLTPGSLARVRSARPLVDGGSPSMALGTRNRPFDAVTFGPTVAANVLGSCPFDISARYHRGRITLPAGQSWNHVMGIDDIDFRAEGRQ